LQVGVAEQKKLIAEHD